MGQDIHETIDDYEFYEGVEYVFHVMYPSKAHTDVKTTAEIMKKADVPNVLGIHYCQTYDLSEYKKDFKIFRLAEEGETFYL